MGFAHAVFIYGGRVFTVTNQVFKVLIYLNGGKLLYPKKMN
jgi:hypothetical protein